MSGVRHLSLAYLRPLLCDPQELARLQQDRFRRPSPDPRRLWRALLAVATLLLSIFGPLLDHHYAERRPAHDHVYVGAAGPDHAHGNETAHRHHGHQGSGAFPNPQGLVIILIDLAAAGDYFMPLAAPALWLSAATLPLRPLLDALDCDALGRESLAPSPPEQPPRL